MSYKIFDSLMEGIQIIDRDWKYIYLNDTAILHSRLKREDLIRHTMMEIYQGIENTQMFAVLESVMESRVASSILNEYQYPDQSIGYFELIIEPIEAGILIMSIDVTEQKKYEQELLKTINELRERKKTIKEQSITLEQNITERNKIIQDLLDEKEFVEALFKFSEEGMILCNGNGEIIRINDKALKLFGYEHSELLGKKIELLIPESLREKHVENRNKFNQNPRPRAMGLGLDLKARKKDGSLFYVEISLSPYKKDNIQYVIAFIVDITLRKQQEKEIIQQNKS